MNQRDYLLNMLDNLPEDWKPHRRCTTVGQSGPPPEIEVPTPCPAEVRSILGSLLYAARCTRPDLSFPVARVARFTDRWCEWADKELRHLLSYVSHTVDYGLIYEVGGTVDIETLRLVTYSDANFAAPFSTGGHITFLANERGTVRLPLEWRAKRQPISATSSGESEALEWGAAAKTTVRLAAIVETMRMQPVAATDYVDNDAVRMAVARGSSLALGHLGKHGEVNFRYLSQCGIVLKRVDTADNVADIFTKVLSAQKMNHLLRGILEPEVEPEHRAVVAHRSPCPAANSSDLGPAAMSLVCVCALPSRPRRVLDVDGTPG